MLESFKNMLVNLLRRCLHALEGKDDENLEFSRDQMHTILTHIEESVEICDEDANYLFVNKAFERLTGYSREEVIGKKPSLLRHPDIPDSHYKQMEESLLATGNWKGETKGLKKDGTSFYQNIILNQIHDESGKLICHISIRRDITDKKLDEQEKEKIIQMMIQTGKLSTIGDQAACLIHDINNPLAIISSACMVLNKSELSKKQQKNLDKIRLSVERMQRLVKGMQHYLHYDSESLESAVSIYEVLESAKELYNSQLKTGKIQIELDLKQGLPDLYGNRSQIESIFTNLISNSKDAFSLIDDNRKKRIIVTGYQDENNQLILDYSDNAGGIPDKVAKDLFEPFSTSKPKGKGTGLGMHILKTALNKLNGQVKVESVKGLGTKFKISFPIQSANDNPALNKKKKTGAAA